jgi:hypothetical protein
MISVVGGGLQKIWCPIKPGATIYVGSLVCLDQSALDEGLIVRPIAAGVSNTTNKDRPFGVCVGTNNKNPVFSNTYKAEYITDPGATGIRSNTAEYVGVEGPWGKGDKRAMVEVMLIGPGTVLRAPIRNGDIGTNVTVLTSSAGNANGLTVTTDACDFTPVANLATIYCRSGQNAGQYRITDDTSTTVAAWDVEMLKTTVTVGETYVRVPVRHNGVSYVIIGDGTVASFIDASDGMVTDYDIIHVHRLDLSQAGNEYAEFVFDNDAFCTNRA